MTALAPSKTIVAATLIRLAAHDETNLMRRVVKFSPNKSFDTIAALLTASSTDSPHILTIGDHEALIRLQKAFADMGGWQAGADDAAHMDAIGARLVACHSDEWPSRLEDMDTDAPLALWVIGQRHLADTLHESITVTGARAHTAYGEHVAADLGFDLVKAGSTVVTTGGFGIDGAVLRGAMALESRFDQPATTVAMFASGLDRLVPAANHDLFEQVTAHGGLLISEFAPGLTPTRHRSLRRGRVMAAMTEATVVVEAGWRSGAITAAHCAQRLGRATAAVPGPITSVASAGAHALIRDTDAALVTDANDILSLLLTQRTADGVG